MNILCIGCTGFLGAAVRRLFYEAGHQVWVVARSQPRGLRLNEGVLPFDSDWMESFAKVDAVVNLSGESISKFPWNASQKGRIVESRVGFSHQMVGRMSRIETLPKVWINASAVGFYGDQGSQILTETSPNGVGFLPTVVRQWEDAVERMGLLGIREVRMRFGPIIGADGGVLDRLKMIYKMGLGGRLGDGNQYFPWVHIDDAARSIEWVIEQGISGPVNVVSPGLIQQKDFSQLLGVKLRRPTIIPTPAWLLKATMGDYSELLLHSQRVVPQVLENSRFHFNYVSLTAALDEALK